jgi:hypothetical protein
MITAPPARRPPAAAALARLGAPFPIWRRSHGQVPAHAHSCHPLRFVDGRRSAARVMGPTALGTFGPARAARRPRRIRRRTGRNKADRGDSYNSRRIGVREARCAERDAGDGGTGALAAVGRAACGGPECLARRGARSTSRFGGRQGGRVLPRTGGPYDKVVRSTHGVNCTGSCSWKVYVKDGIITWEQQQTDYPSVGATGPSTSRAGARAGAFSWYTYSPTGSATRTRGCADRDVPRGEGPARR